MRRVCLVIVVPMQATAQFDLLFGACVLAGLLPLNVLARVLLASLFYLGKVHFCFFKMCFNHILLPYKFPGGFNNILMWLAVRLLVRQKLSLLLPWGASQVAADVLTASASGVQLVSRCTCA